MESPWLTWLPCWFFGNVWYRTAGNLEWWTKSVTVDRNLFGNIGGKTSVQQLIKTRPPGSCSTFPADFFRWGHQSPAPWGLSAEGPHSMLLRAIPDGPARGAEATFHPLLSRDLLQVQRLLFIATSYFWTSRWKGSLPLSYFLPTMTKLCSVLIVCNKPSNSWIELWFCLMYLQSHATPLGLTTVPRNKVSKINRKFGQKKVCDPHIHLSVFLFSHLFLFKSLCLLTHLYFLCLFISMASQFWQGLKMAFPGVLMMA